MSGNYPDCASDYDEGGWDRNLSAIRNDVFILVVFCPGLDTEHLANVIASAKGNATVMPYSEIERLMDIAAG